MKKIKILYFDHYFPFLLKNTNSHVGGASIEWYAWIEGLIKNGIEVGVLTWKGSNQYIGRKLEFELIEGYSNIEKNNKMNLSFKTFFDMYKTIKKYNPDYIVQEVMGPITGMLSIISQILRKKFIFRLASDRDADQRKKTNLPYYKLVLYNYGLKHANYICCQNKYQLSKMKIKYPHKNIFLIHNPYILDESIIRTHQKNREYIAWVGSHRKEKNLQQLLIIVKQFPEIKFKITGKETNMTDAQTKIAVQKLRTCKNVEFVGFLPTEGILPFLNNAIALLNTSHYEGFPITFLESWSVGTPVITTRFANPDNIISDYNLGLVAHDYENLPNMINELINSSKYNDIFDRSRDYLRKNHNPIDQARKFISELA